MRFLISACFIIMLLQSGCESLPDGKPPEGEIVKPPDLDRILSKKAAVNYMCTSLRACCPEVGLALRPPYVLDDFKALPGCPFNTAPWEVWSQMTKMKMILPVFKEDGDMKCLVMRSEIKDAKLSAPTAVKCFEWNMSLFDQKDGKVIWTERVLIKSVATPQE